MAQEKKKIRPNAMKSSFLRKAPGTVTASTVASQSAPDTGEIISKGFKKILTAPGPDMTGWKVGGKGVPVGKTVGAKTVGRPGMSTVSTRTIAPAMQTGRVAQGAGMTGWKVGGKGVPVGKTVGAKTVGRPGMSTVSTRTIAPAMQTGRVAQGAGMSTNKPTMPTDTGSHLMPAGAPSVLSANKMTGGLMTDESTGERYSIAGGRGGNMMKVGADGTIDTGFKERSIQRPNLNLMDKPKMVGGYEVSDSTWTKDEAERFGRQPGRGATFAERGFVQGATGGSGRSIGGQSSGDPLEMARKILGPMKIDTKGFSGTGAQARAHTQEVSYNERLAKLAGELTQTSMQQGGQTDRAIMGVEADVARTAMGGDIESRSQRERFGLRGQEAAQQEGYDVEAADVAAGRASAEKAKERMWDLVKSKGQKPMSEKEQANLRFKAQELYISSGGEEVYGSFGKFMNKELSGMEGMVGLGGRSQRPGISFPDMVAN